MLDIFILLTVIYPAEKSIQEIVRTDYGILHYKYSNTTNQSNVTWASVYIRWRLWILSTEKWLLSWGRHYQKPHTEHVHLSIKTEFLSHHCLHREKVASAYTCWQIFPSFLTQKICVQEFFHWMSGHTNFDILFTKPLVQISITMQTDNTTCRFSGIFSMSASKEQQTT